MSRAAQLRELSRRLVRGLYPNPAKTFNPESPSTVIVKDYQLLSTNYMKPAKIDYHPFLCSMEPQYKYPLSSNIHFNAAHVYIAHGSCFPVAPNVLLTARHAVYDSRLIDAGYKVSAILSHNPFLSHESLCCRVIPGVSKVEIEEKDPITGQNWIKFLSKDYIFLEVLQPVPHWNTVLLPKAAREGDSIVFPALRPPIENIFDAQLVSDTLFALEEAFIYSGLSEQEAKERVKRLNIDFVTLSKFIGTESTIQGEAGIFLKG